MSGIEDPQGSTDITELLRAWSDGDQRALGELTRIVYTELRRLAGRYMRRERPEHSLQATALVNEAYLRLVDDTRMQWQNRAHFFAVSAGRLQQAKVMSARAADFAQQAGRPERTALFQTAAA